MSTGILRSENDSFLGGRSTTWTLTLEESDADAMEREQLDMIQDALWLIEATLARRVEGPLTLPRTGLPIRAALDGEGEGK